MIIFNSKLTNYQRVIWWCHSSTWTTGCINKAGMLYSGFRGFRGCLPRYPHCQWSYVQQKQMPSRMMDKQPFGRCRVNQEFQREISPKSRRGWSARIDPLPGYQKWRPKRWQCPPPRDCQRSLHHEAPRYTVQQNAESLLNRMGCDSQVYSNLQPIKHWNMLEMLL